MRRAHCWLDVGDMAGLLPVAVLKGIENRARDGLVTALFWDEQQAGQVGRDASAAQEGEHDEGDPDERDVDAEVIGEACGDAGEHAPVVGAAQRRAAGPDRLRFCAGVRESVHDSSVRPRAVKGYGERPWSDPDPGTSGRGAYQGKSRWQARVRRAMMVVCSRNRANRQGRRSASVTGMPGTASATGRAV